MTAVTVKTAAALDGVSARYLDRLSTALALIDRTTLDNAISVIHAAWQRGSQIITCGNGGSAMTALHFVTDWGKLVPMTTGRVLRARSLLDNVGLLTAYANDVSYADVFSGQLQNILCPGDVVIAISGSGNSPNVIKAIEFANGAGAETIGLCGFSGGLLRQIAQHVVWVPADDMQLCEDAHAIFGHIVVQTLCGMQTESVNPVRGRRIAANG
jgi:D-sedoheptulose 7-phosphate isomerase